MSTQPQQFTRPIPGVLYGITHQFDGTPVIREQKLVKISIGQTKGPAIMVWIENDAEGKPVWRGMLGYKSRDTKVTTLNFTDRAQAETWYRAKKKEAPICNFPRKLSFFTFNRQLPDGSFECDFDAIAAHGAKPTEIPIIFFSDNPLDYAFQMWSKSELRCTGDGINAERSFNLANTPEEKDLAQQAKAAGLRLFPVLDGCFNTGCKYVGARDGCKPHADLKFQLTKNLKLGGTSYFTTTGIRSIQQLYSSIYRFKSATGGGDPQNGRMAGLIVNMTLKAYTTNHEGQAATQYGVSLEIPADDLDALEKRLIEQRNRFSRNLPATRPQASLPRSNVPLLTSGEEDEVVEPIYESEAAQAAAIDAEFNDGDGEGEESTEEATPSDPAPAQPAPQVSGNLADRIRKNTKAKPEPVTVAASVPATQDPAPSAADPTASTDNSDKGWF
jgi:hypothetical protein